MASKSALLSDFVDADAERGHGHGHSHGHGHGHGSDSHAADAHADSKHRGHGHGHGHGSEEQKGGKGHGHGHGHGHCHGTEHGHAHGAKEAHGSHDDGGVRKLQVALALSCLFMCGEVVGGLIANSIAVLTDAAHLLSDVAGMGVSLYAMSLAKHAATPVHSWGFARAQVAGALASVFMVWAVTLVLVVEAISRLRSPEKVDGLVMLITSSAGLGVNLLMMLVLGGHGGHGHSHGGGGGGGGGHAHGGGDGDNINVRAALVHAFGDALLSICVIISASLIYWDPQPSTWEKYPKISKLFHRRTVNWDYADPTCTLLFSLLVLATTKGIIKEALGIVMMKSPDDVDSAEVYAALQSVEGVTAAADLHVWRLVSKDLLASVRLRATDSSELCTVLGDATKVLAGFGVKHSTVQVEHDGCKPLGTNLFCGLSRDEPDE